VAAASNQASLTNVNGHEEDMALVERMLAGDEAAYEAFGDRYFAALYRFTLARAHGEYDLARQTVQTALAKALPKLHTYRGEAALLTWLCSCCRNELRMHRRRERSAPAEVELTDAVHPAPGFAPPPSDPEAAALRGERAHRVHMALDALPSHYARALEWKYLDRLPVAEIAERLGTSAKATESVLSRARAAFRKRYDEVQAALAARETGDA
jgi:RNA polymerase sigma-70 factor, ECF subfamily